MKFFYKEDTIAALSTPPGEGGIAVIRISGSRAFDIAHRLYKKPGGGCVKFEHFHFYFGHVADPCDGKFIDEALFLIMKSPHSYTREDVVEIQCHGGMTPVIKILELIFAMGARSALPGEFTKRAFLNGRIDLIQAEAVMDIIRARTSKSLEIASTQLAGKFSAELADFKDRILDLIAKIEAPLDYPDEDLFACDPAELAASINSLLSLAIKMKSLCEGGRLYRDGVKVAITGKPNVGKSSILNMLLCEDRAIVTEYAGTTRDIIEETCVIDSIAINLCDTAGLRDTDDFIEKLGVEKTRESIEKADFVIVVLDISSGLDENDEIVLRLASRYEKDFMIVFNKADLEAQLNPEEIAVKYAVDSAVISTVSKDGGDNFKNILAGKLKKVYKSDAGAVFLASQRHREAIASIADSLADAAVTINSGYPHDMLLISLREVLAVISELCGESFDEAVLDKIFSEFCIGK